MVDLGVLASRAAIGAFHLPPEDVAERVDHVFFGCGYLSFPLNLCITQILMIMQAGKAFL